MAGLIGRKIGMTSIFDEKGEAIPCTLIEAGPCWVTQTKSQGNDGYDALQIGFGVKKEGLLKKPFKGHLSKSGVKTSKILREFKGFKSDTFKPGDEIKVDAVFSKGDRVRVTGISKGKGFQGVVKRHHFGGGSRTHGQSDRERAPGSIGSSSYPSRVFKGTRMAGRMGGKRTSIRNLTVLKVIPESNALLVKGSVPGAINGFLEITKQ
jgi:large subunit ribosomal protein L3